MSTPTTGSVNIAILDSKIVANLCDGIFYTDVIPSVWIGTGYNNVLGASLKVTNPYGVVIKNFPTSGYDIYPPMTEVVELAVPTQANNFQYGSYIFEIQLTDADNTVYTITKTVNICAPDAKNKTRKYGTLSATLDGNCQTGKVTVIADTVPTYKGKISDSQVNAFTLEYPTSSGISVLSTDQGSFSATLFEGVYKFAGTICANYNLGDNVYVKVNYKVKREKNIRCLLDESCIYAKLAQLDAQTKSDCTDAEKKETQDIIINALRLVKTIEVAANAGFDASDFIDELEALLGCVCTCNCGDGTPIINNNPTGDFSIQGCNVTSETVDQTTVYTINNYTYIVEIVDNGGALVITAPTLDDCTQTQTLTFNIEPLYSQIKNQIVNSTEYNFWASIINHSWDSLDISCLPVTQDLWNSYTHAQRTQIILNAICTGGECEASISDNTTSSSANNVIITWNNVENVYEVAIYMDDILQGTVLNPTETFTINGAADGDAHTYRLVAKCSNGSIGNSLTGSFTYIGCPTIAAPTVSDSSIVDAGCPYDLTPLVNTLPVGITAEWHNLNNTNASSLVPDPTEAMGGTYFVFAKNADGCYSLGTQVILTCSTDTGCTAPQTLLVEAISGGNRIRFQSATYPPPLNSYTVKRRLTSDPDVGGSYTTIGTPTWNSTAARWEILDATAVDNTLYTYRAISNCASTSPYTDYEFANIDCPTLTLTPNDTTIDYEFTNVGGEVSKYEVSIYDSLGTTLIHTDTILPSFSTPISGTFFYLDEGVTYQVRVKVFIGTYSITCGFVVTSTTGGDTYTISYTNNDPSVNVTLRIGNNYTAPNTVIYNGLYTTDPVTGTDGTNLPAVNATVLFIVGGGKTLLSITCNGVSAVAGGNSASWVGVNGSIVINFLTD